MTAVKSADSVPPQADVDATKDTGSARPKLNLTIGKQMSGAKSLGSGLRIEAEVRDLWEAGPFRFGLTAAGAFGMKSSLGSAEGHAAGVTLSGRTVAFPPWTKWTSAQLEATARITLCRAQPSHYQSV
jgi:hypothetical protein